MLAATAVDAASPLITLRRGTGWLITSWEIAESSGFIDDLSGSIRQQNQTPCTALSCSRGAFSPQSPRSLSVGCLRNALVHKCLNLDHPKGGR